MPIKRADHYTNWNAFLNGDSWAGRVSKMKLPSLAEKVEAHRGAAMGMELDHKQGIEPLELTFTTTDIATDIHKLVATRDAQKQMIVFRGSSTTDESPSETTNTEVTVQGSITKSEIGDFEAGSKVDTDFTMKSIIFYELKVNGTSVHKFDLFNHELVIDGTDQWAAEKADLQL